MTLLREAQRNTQTKEDSLNIERRAREISHDLRASAEYLLKTYGKQHPPAILLKRAGRVLLSPSEQMVGRRMLEINMARDGEEIGITLVSRDKDPKKSPVLHLYVEGTDSHLQMYRDDAWTSHPHSGAAILKIGQDAPGPYRGNGSRYFENPRELKKYKEILDMVREKLEPSTPPAQNPQA